MSIAYILLIAFGGYAAISFFVNQRKYAERQANRIVNPPGVSYYDPVGATQRPQQLAAFEQVNPGYGIDGTSVTQPGYAPAFGPNENMPAAGTEWYQ